LKTKVYSLIKFWFMKCFLIVLFLPLAGFGQTLYDSIPYNGFGKVSFERRFDIKGSKDSLFNKAKMWSYSILKKPHSPIEDSIAGTIFFSSNIDFNYPQQYVHKVADRKTKEIRQNDIGGFSNLKFTVKIFVRYNEVRMFVQALSYKPSFSNDYNDFDSRAVETIKNYPVKTLEDQANIATMEFLYREIIRTVATLQDLFLLHMK
jgi:hypothetical protein